MKKQIHSPKKLTASLLLSASMLGLTCLTSLASEDVWKEDGDSWFYYDTDGNMVTDRWIIDKIGTTPNLIAYYVDSEGKWVEDAVYSGCEGNWIKDDTGWWFSMPDGSYPRSEFEYIDGKWYFFDSAGYMETGLIPNIETGLFSYFYPDGSMAENAGWLTLPDGRWIYVKGSYCVSGTATPDGYQMDENGIWQEGTAQTIETQTLALTVPADWEGRYIYETDSEGSIMFYEKKNHVARMGGHFLTIHADTEQKYSHMTDIIPGELIKREGDMVCFATFASDVQWASEWKAEYEKILQERNLLFANIRIK